MIDFQAVKKATTIEEVARGFLQLKVVEDGDSLRAPCPSCDSDNPRNLIITPEKGLFYCFKARKGGDLLSLVSHCHGSSVKDAAVALSAVYMDSESKGEETQAEPKAEAETPKSEGGFSPLKYLDCDHPLVEELGFKDIAQKAGIGYAGKGMMRTHVAIPVRLEDGTIVGYIGIKDTVKVPPKWRVA